MVRLLSLLSAVSLLAAGVRCAANGARARHGARQTSDGGYDSPRPDEGPTTGTASTDDQPTELTEYNDADRVVELEGELGECRAGQAGLLKDKEQLQFEGQLLASGHKLVTGDLKAMLSSIIEGLTERRCEGLPAVDSVYSNRTAHCKFKALPHFPGFAVMPASGGQGGAEIALKLAHPSLVNVLRYTPKEGKLWTEYSPETTSLRAHFIKNRKKFAGTQGTDMIKYIAARLLLALHYIHSSGVVHRKVVLDNVVVLQDGRAKLMNAEGSYALAGQFKPASDIWACGLIIYQLASNLGLPPGVRKPRAARPEDAKQLRPDFYRLDGRSETFNSLLKHMLALNDDERPSALDLLQHPFFAGASSSTEQGSD